MEKPLAKGEGSSCWVKAFDGGLFLLDSSSAPMVLRTSGMASAALPEQRKRKADEVGRADSEQELAGVAKQARADTLTETAGGTVAAASEAASKAAGVGIGGAVASQSSGGAESDGQQKRRPKRRHAEIVSKQSDGPPRVATLSPMRLSLHGQKVFGTPEQERRMRGRNGASKPPFETAAPILESHHTAASTEPEVSRSSTTTTSSSSSGTVVAPEGATAFVTTPVRRKRPAKRREPSASTEAGTVSETVSGAAAACSDPKRFSPRKFVGDYAEVNRLLRDLHFESRQRRELQQQQRLEQPRADGSSTRPGMPPIPPRKVPKP